MSSINEVSQMVANAGALDPVVWGLVGVAISGFAFVAGARQMKRVKARDAALAQNGGDSDREPAKRVVGGTHHVIENPFVPMMSGVNGEKPEIHLTRAREVMHKIGKEPKARVVFRPKGRRERNDPFVARLEKLA